MSNHIKTVAFATGNSGSYMLDALVAGGKHSITIISRESSTNIPSTPPPNCRIARVDYSNPSSLVSALTGHDCLLITLAPRAPPDTQSLLIHAAATAKIPWILPNEWSPDSAHAGLVADISGAMSKLPPIRSLITSLGVSSYICVSTGFWYEWSLAIPSAYDFDFDQKQVTFVDDGETKINTSTWPQVGRAVAGLLSLSKEKLEEFRNGHVYVSSFTVSQKDMFASALRMTGTEEGEWTVTYEGHRERYDRAKAQMERKGYGLGFVEMMYTRGFFPDDSGNFEKRLGTQNELLGLPTEDLDQATAEAIKRVGKWP